MNLDIKIFFLLLAQFILIKKFYLQEYIYKLYKQTVSEGSSSIENVQSTNFASQLLDQIISNDLGSSRMPEFDPERQVKEMISRFNSQNRVSCGDFSFSIFKHVYSTLSQNTVLRDICLSIVAAPCTSASVERCFSVLKLTLSHLRNRLNDSTINNTLLLHCNSDLLNVINFDNLI